MSKTKRSLPEDVDITDPKDVGDNQPMSAEPTQVDYAMNELYRSIYILERNSLVGYADELDALMVRLADVYEKARKPF
jgi:hypothetical protein